MIGKGKPPGKILVVEDECDVREVIVETLEFEGYRVRSTASGSEALSMLAEEAFDAMLVDMRLEGAVSGLETIRLCRSLEHKPKIVVVSATPKAELFEIFEREGLAECVVKFLEKPVDLKPEVLNRHLEILLERE